MTGKNPQYRRRVWTSNRQRPNAVGQAISVPRPIIIVINDPSKHFRCSPDRPRLELFTLSASSDHDSSPLPLHLVGLVATAQAESRGEVAAEHVDLLDVRQKRLVDRLLVRHPGAGNRLLL
jgi:hypothetical protein